ncbi:MAG: hypothetical protein WCY37_02470 [Candidatus Dojkabacteria bacterium]
MKNALRLILFLLFGSILFVSFPKNAHAAVDVELTEEENVLSVEVDSNGGYIEGLVMEISHPEEVLIDEANIVKSEQYCTISNNVTLKSDSFSIECFNQENTVIEGTILSIPFTTDLESYYFYVNQDNLDLGVLNLGSVQDINRPENITFETFTEEEEVEVAENTGVVSEDIISFLSDNSTYVLIAGILVLGIAIIFLFKTLKKGY